MYVFNKITVNPQLPKSIEKLETIANNLWWSWNSEFLRLFQKIDVDLWGKCEKNPVKFLKLVSQEKLENKIKDQEFLKEYDKIVENFENYMNSKNTWFSKTYPENTNDLIAYFSAEYGLDQILSIYSGGLGILSGDHLKSSSDLGIPLVAVGLLYKNGYFHQKIDRQGNQETEYRRLDVEKLPVIPVKDEDDNDLIIHLKFPKRRLYLKVWQINVGRVKLYLMDSDIEENHPEYRDITTTLYGGDQEMRISQEIVLGMGGVRLLKTLGLKPTLYHMNEGHSSFLIFELIKNTIKEKELSFEMARDIVSSQTVFTTHTPVPAGNDIFPTTLVEKYFKDYWDRFSISKDEFMKMGMKPNPEENAGFNMAILALKIAGKKNGVSRLHCEVSRELFADVWPEISPDESPIGYVTNGIHTCSWLAPNLKELYNQYLTPYWQDNIYKNETWEKIKNIPNVVLWKEHLKRKESLIRIVKKNVTDRLKRCGYPYDEIHELVSHLNPNALTIGFARRFATYKRATLLFKDLVRITQLVNDENRPIQIFIAGKAHPKDKEGQDLIRYIHELSMKPQFRGKLFLLENYNLAMSKHLISGVDIWLNTPRRPMEASGTSGEKASVNGVVNFSVLDGWWAEGYNGENGWTIGREKDFENYEIQDYEDSESLYNTLENKIVPIYYDINEDGIPDKWIEIMKNSIISTGGGYSTARMLVDYCNKLYMPLIKQYHNYYTDLGSVGQFNEWKREIIRNWNNIVIKEYGNPNNETVDAGDILKVSCEVNLPNISPDNIEVQAYYGRIKENGVIEKIKVIPMRLVDSEEENRTYFYDGEIEMETGGNYGYTFRVMPKHEMILDAENLNLIKWIEK